MYKRQVGRLAADGEYMEIYGLWARIDGLCDRIRDLDTESREQDLGLTHLDEITDLAATAARCARDARTLADSFAKCPPRPLLS